MVIFAYKHKSKQTQNALSKGQNFTTNTPNPKTSLFWGLVWLGLVEF